jgi:cyclophilin family peptidyl-prolyl cis-trans isomerase
VPSDKRARQRAARQARLEAEAKRQKQRKQVRNGVIVVVIIGLVVGLVFLLTGNNNKPSQASSKSTTTTSTTTASKAHDAVLQTKANTAAVGAGCPASTKTRVNTLSWSSAPAMAIDTSKTYTATVKTTTGTFVITLDAKTAPKTVNNFVFLAQHNFYHCVLFHRVIPNFMDQTGDPTGTGTGGPGYTIPDENPAKASSPSQQYPVGSVAMANTGQPNSGGSQWFIVAGPQGESLPNSYALFGQVTSGMNVIQTINQQGSTAGVPPDVTQRILSVSIAST